MSGVVLSLCDYSGVMVEPWAEAGYECILVDARHRPGRSISSNPDDRIERLGLDIFRWTPSIHTPTNLAIVFAFPPCTDLAVSGARWFKDKGLTAVWKALALVDACRIICENSGAPWFIENPVSTISTYWREPDYAFDPCEFGDPWTKKTCLWTGGGFVMPRGNPLPLFGDAGTRVEPTEGSKMHLLPPSVDRAQLRSETPAGFARAVFEANKAPAGSSA